MIGSPPFSFAIFIGDLEGVRGTTRSLVDNTDLTMVNHVSVRPGMILSSKSAAGASRGGEAYVQIQGHRAETISRSPVQAIFFVFFWLRIRFFPGIYRRSYWWRFFGISCGILWDIILYNDIMWDIMISYGISYRYHRISWIYSEKKLP